MKMAKNVEERLKTLEKQVQVLCEEIDCAKDGINELLEAFKRLLVSIAEGKASEELEVSRLLEKYGRWRTPIPIKSKMSVTREKWQQA